MYFPTSMNQGRSITNAFNILCYYGNALNVGWVW